MQRQVELMYRRALAVVWARRRGGICLKMYCSAEYHDNKDIWLVSGRQGRSEVVEDPGTGLLLLMQAYAGCLRAIA
jgi:hypothetical protein